MTVSFPLSTVGKWEGSPRDRTPPQTSNSNAAFPSVLNVHSGTVKYWWPIFQEMNPKNSRKNAHFSSLHRFARMSVTLPILRAECTDFPGLQIMKLGYFSWDALWGKNGVFVLIQGVNLTNTEIPDHGRGQIRGGTGNHHMTTTHGYRKCVRYATNTPASARAPPHPGSDLVWSSPDATMAVVLFCTLNLVLLSTHFWRRKGILGKTRLGPCLQHLETGDWYS
jgi:hypothetical protein